MLATFLLSIISRFPMLLNMFILSVLMSIMYRYRTTLRLSQFIVWILPLWLRKNMSLLLMVSLLSEVSGLLSCHSCHNLSFCPVSPFTPSLHVGVSADVVSLTQKHQLQACVDSIMSIHCAELLTLFAA